MEDTVDIVRRLFLVYRVVYSLTLKMEAIRSAGTLDCLRATRRYKPKRRHYSSNGCLGHQCHNTYGVNPAY
jgi:hypothetical protein